MARLMFSQDFKELLSAFSERHVKYLIVGGYALAIHAQPRATKDLDLFVQPGSDNAQAVFAALAKFGAPLQGLTPEDFMHRGSYFRMGTAPQMIEIFPEVSGIEFDEAWGRRVEEVIDSKTGQKAFFISAKDFIADKPARDVLRTSPTWLRCKELLNFALRTSEWRSADASGHRFPAN